MIDTKALRSRVLDLAIQGKLTEQLDSDGTAEELYQQIQAEKQKLVKEGKIKKEKPLPEITDDDIPFEIPSNWKWVQLGELGEGVNNAFADGPFGSNLKREHYTSEKQVRIIQLSNIGEDGWRNENEKYTTFEHLKTIERSEVFVGNIVIAKMMPAGRAMIVPDTGTKYVLSSDCIKYVPNHALYSKYICYAINTDTFRKQVSGNIHGIGRERTSLTLIKKYTLPIPPLAEQKRIVERVEEIFRVLDTIDEAQEKYSANVESLRSKLITAGIQGRLTQQLDTDGTAEELYQQIQAEKQELIKEGKLKKEKPLPPISPDEIPFEIPQNWKWVRLEDIGSTNIGLTYHPTDVSTNGTIVIRSSNIQNGKMDYSDIVRVDCKINENQYLKQNDIVICARNGSKSLVGKNAIYYGESDKVAFGAFMAVFRTICFRYVYYYFNTFAFKRYFSGDDSKQINQVTQAILKSSIVPLPPLAEQKRIADVLEKALGAIG